MTKETRGDDLKKMLARKIRLGHDDISEIQSIAYNQGELAGRPIYLFDADAEWYDELEYACPNFCCTCCGCDCGYYYGEDPWLDDYSAEDELIEEGEE